MNNYYNASAKKKEKEKIDVNHEAEIIPWPDMESILEKKEKQGKQKRVRLDQKFIYYKGQKFPILQFKKTGYEKLLKLLVKEIGG
jgi:hypothetical protein